MDSNGPRDGADATRTLQAPGEGLSRCGVLLLLAGRRGPPVLASYEDLERFARNPDDPHLPAWRRFNQIVGSDGSVGIFHETYVVEAGRHEEIYSNMPVFGLAKATEHVPAKGRLETARRRLRRGENEPAVLSPQQPRA